MLVNNIFENEPNKLKFSGNVQDYTYIFKYLESDAVLNDDLKTYNDWIDNILSKNINNIKIQFGDNSTLTVENLRLLRPQYQQNNKHYLLTPYLAYEQGMNYESSLCTDFILKNSNKINVYPQIEIARIPIMVKSRFCNVYGIQFPNKDFSLEYSNDQGGYFIINNKEKDII